MKPAKPILLLFLIGLAYQLSFAQKRFESTYSSVRKEEKEKLDQFLKKYEVFTLDYQNINALAKSTKNDIPFILSINDIYEWNMILEENDLRSPEYRSVITTEDGDIFQEKGQCHTYKGFIAGDTLEYIRLTINENGLEGYIKQRSDFIIIKPVKDFLKEAELGEKTEDTEDKENQGGKLFIAYQSNDIIGEAKDGCGVTQTMEDAYLNQIKSSETDNSSSRIADLNFRVVDMATEADGEWFGIHGANSNAQILTILNQVEGGILGIRFRQGYLSPSNTYLITQPLTPSRPLLWMEQDSSINYALSGKIIVPVLNVIWYIFSQVGR